MQTNVSLDRNGVKILVTSNTPTKCCNYICHACRAQHLRVASRAYIHRLTHTHTLWNIHIHTHTQTHTSTLHTVKHRRCLQWWRVATMLPQSAPAYCLLPDATVRVAASVCGCHCCFLHAIAASRWCQVESHFGYVRPHRDARSSLLVKRASWKL